MAKPFQAKQLQGNTSFVITAHVQGKHIYLNLGLGPTPSAPKQWKSDVHGSQGLKPCKREIATDEV